MASVKQLRRFDAAEHLKSDGDIAFFVADAMSTGDSAYIAHALGVVARAKGMTRIAEDTGLSREQLYRSFSLNGNPTLKTTLGVFAALDIELSVRPAKKRKSPRTKGSERGQSARRKSSTR